MSALQRPRHVAWRARKRALGLCIHCGAAPARADRYGCEACLIRKAAAQRPRNLARDARARAARNAPPAVNENAAACRERYEALRSVGLCSKCKADSRSKAECLACRRRRLDRRAA